ncbi:MAG TPA: hypothetical protein VM531_10095 [Sphingomicrobium sp.]|jgi:hypothetical protein|nr:hypothetical protein [Sphingomicrobium sp.]
MSDHSASLLPATAQPPSDRQRLFLLYFTGTLIDLVVLGLFDEFSEKVWVESFSIALLAAVVLQILLKVTIAIEHKVIAYMKQFPGKWMTALRYFVAWLILFGSKFVILEALTMTFGEQVRFEGPLHGVVWLIIVVVTMVVAEELVVRLFRKLA